MRTIKEGVLPSEQLFVGVCFHCRWEGEAPLRELTASSDGRNGTDYHCTCPTKGCGRQVSFTPKRENPKREITPKWVPPADQAPDRYIDRSGLKYEGGEE